MASLNAHLTFQLASDAAAVVSTAGEAAQRHVTNNMLMRAWLRACLAFSVLGHQRPHAFLLLRRARRRVALQRSSAVPLTVKLHARWARLLLERRDPV